MSESAPRGFVAPFIYFFKNMWFFRKNQNKVWGILGESSALDNWDRNVCHKSPTILSQKRRVHDERGGFYFLFFNLLQRISQPKSQRPAGPGVCMGGEGDP